MSEFIQIVTTCASRDEALAIATSLVEKHLAGCAQLGGPIASVYRWQGRVENGEEWLCVAKTRRTLYAEVEREITRLHSYDTPEIVALPIEAGSDNYLAWLRGETIGPKAGKP